MNFPISSRTDNQHCKNPGCDHTLISHLRDRIPKKEGAQKMQKTPSSSSEILTAVLAYTSGSLNHHQKLRPDPAFQEVPSKYKGVIVSQTRGKKHRCVLNKLRVGQLSHAGRSAQEE